jgi:hypothetical protein
MKWILMCVAVLLAACDEVDDPCDTPWSDQQIQCLIHADLQAIEKRLQPPKSTKVVPPKCPAYDPDEVCEGECEAARGAVAEYKRKFEGMCATAKGMCYEMQGLGHWKDQDCDRLCEFFGDGSADPAEKP